MVPAGGRLADMKKSTMYCAAASVPPPARDSLSQRLPPIPAYDILSSGEMEGLNYRQVSRCQRYSGVEGCYTCFDGKDQFFSPDRLAETTHANSRDSYTCLLFLLSSHPH